jgi:hypothetical protein
MGLFDGVKKADLNFGSNYAREGNYIVFIRRIAEGKTRKGRDFVAVEKVVLEVISAPEEKAHKPGEQMSDLMMADKDSFLGNFKTMVVNLMGVQAEEVDEDACNLITSDTQPLAGIVAEVNNIERIGKESQKPYTLKKYVRSLPVEEILARFDEEQLKKWLTAEEMEYLGGKHLGD